MGILSWKCHFFILKKNPPANILFPFVKAVHDIRGFWKQSANLASSSKISCLNFAIAGKIVKHIIKWLYKVTNSFTLKRCLLNISIYYRFIYAV